jgi:vanillate O-demethylase ferredoxin subunit
MTSCENGVCGTCVTTVLAGEPDHRDEYFTGEERASNGLITLCVSRVHSGRLVLDF